MVPLRIVGSGGDFRLSFPLRTKIAHNWLLQTKGKDKDIFRLRGFSAVGRGSQMDQF